MESIIQLLSHFSLGSETEILKILQVDSCLAANLLRAAVHALNFSSSDFEIEALKRRNLKG